MTRSTRTHPAQAALDALRHALVIDPDRRTARYERLSPGTRRVYAGALRIWQQWCHQAGVDPLLPQPADLRRCIQERHNDGAGIKTLRSMISAIRLEQELVGIEETASDPIVRDTLAGIAQNGRPPRQARALTSDSLAMIEATACSPRVTGRGKEDDDAAQKRGLVDIALCRVVSDAGLRRSEAAALVWSDLQVWEDQSGRLTIQRSKTDTEPRIVYLTPAGVQALLDIRPAGVNGSASIFNLSAPSISRRIQAAAEAAGLGTGFSGHSGRVGMAQRMSRAGAPTHEIMAQGRWQTARMVGVYTRALEAGRAGRWLE